MEVHYKTTFENPWLIMIELLWCQQLPGYCEDASGDLLWPNSVVEAEFLGTDWMSAYPTRALPKRVFQISQMALSSSDQKFGIIELCCSSKSYYDSHFDQNEGRRKGYLDIFVCHRWKNETSKTASHAKNRYSMWQHYDLIVGSGTIKRWTIVELPSSCQAAAKQQHRSEARFSSQEPSASSSERERFYQFFWGAKDMAHGWVIYQMPLATVHQRLCEKLFFISRCGGGGGELMPAGPCDGSRSLRRPSRLIQPAQRPKILVVGKSYPAIWGKETQLNRWSVSVSSPTTLGSTFFCFLAWPTYQHAITSQIQYW